jgi:hypothetical protein
MNTMDEETRRPPTKRANISTFGGCIDNAFDDKRVTIACISIWFFICLGGFTWLGIFGSEYMRVGPSPTLTYMGMLIDTLPRYLMVAGFVVISTAINDFASDAISPWIQNTVMDHKSRTIPYSKFTMLFISQTWSLYCGTMSVASIALVFAQFDLIMIRLVVDLFVNQYTIRRFLANKSHDPYRYHTEFLNEDETDGLHDNGPDDSSGSFVGRDSAAGVVQHTRGQDYKWSDAEPGSHNKPKKPVSLNDTSLDTMCDDTDERVNSPGQINLSVHPAQMPPVSKKNNKVRDSR